MQNLNNDIFDLFQQAAENYHLDAGKGDWNDIAIKLNSVYNKSKPGISKTKKSSIQFTILLFIISFIAGPVIILKNAESKLSTIKATELTNFKNQFEPDQSYINKAYKVIQHAGGKQGKIASSENSIPASGLNIAPQSDSFAKTTVVYIAGLNNELYFDGTREIVTDHVISTFDLTDKIISAGQPQKVPENLPGMLTKADTALPKNKASLFKSKIYFGMVSGLDFSKVSSASFGKAGTAIGMIAGIKLSQAISIETGLIFTAKNYFSEGKMFKMNKADPSMQGMTINSVVGKSSIIEIPITAKVTIASKGKTSYFISPGIVSYILTNEKNEYHMLRDGVAEKLNAIYQANNHNLPAVASISAGFQHTISARLNLSLAPFVNVPLQGIGIGNLPLKSAGIRLGIYSSLR